MELVSGVVVAGGRSRRLGQDKRRLRLWGEVGPTLLEHTLQVLAPLCAELIVVTTPQVAAQSVAQRSAALAEKVDLDLIGVIENMSWFRGDDGKAYEIFGSGGGQELADHLGVPLLGQVPLLTDLREGGDTGAPIVASDPDSEAAQVFHSIATQV